MNDIKEIPVAFGPRQSLVGMVATPASSDSIPVACLMFNMDANHRVGPRRVNVKLARQLAERGISSIRFDLSGLGDSEQATASEHFHTQAVVDLQAAMDQIESMLGIHRFVVIGLGSGASNGLALAVVDARVIGLLMFDGYAFPSGRSRWERRLRRVLSVLNDPGTIGNWVRSLRRKSTKAGPAATEAFSAYRREPPELAAAVFRRSMSQVAVRGVSILMLYSASLHAVDRGRDQLGRFADAPFMRDVEYDFLAGIDHQLTSLASQQCFMSLVSDWVIRVAIAHTGMPAGEPAMTDFASLSIY